MVYITGVDSGIKETDSILEFAGHGDLMGINYVRHANGTTQDRRPPSTRTWTRPRQQSTGSAGTSWASSAS
eukprot:12773236-Alexandrium_andersonii.AAC.1